MLTSAGLSAMTVVAVIYVNEIFPAAVRGKYQAYAIVIGICGTPVTNLIASLVVPLNDWSWRLVYLWGSLGVLFLLFARYLTESPRWYESKGQFDKADAVLTEIEARVAAEKGPLPEPAPPAEFAPESKAKASLKLLLHKKYLVPTLVLCVLWVTQTIGFFGYSSWAPTLLAQEGLSVGEVALLRGHSPPSAHRWAASSPRWSPTASNGNGCLVVFGVDHRAQRPVLRADVQPDHDRRLRVPGELLRARLHGRRLRLLPGGVRHPHPVAGHLVLLRARPAVQRHRPADHRRPLHRRPATRPSSSSSPAPGCSERSSLPCSAPAPGRPGSPTPPTLQPAAPLEG